MATRKISVSPAIAAAQTLLGDVRDLIEAARLRVASTINSEMTLLYWHIGQHIHDCESEVRQAGCSDKVLPSLAGHLVQGYGGSFSEKNLWRMVQFSTTFPDEPLVISPTRQLSWAHFIALIPLKDALQREYYASMASIERWSARTLRSRIDSRLYERTVLSFDADTLVAQEPTQRAIERMSPALFMRDPYILDLLGLHDAWQEGDLQAAVIREMEAFFLKSGMGFSLVARQRHMQMDDQDFQLDLLFYHRRLRRLVAVELKVGEFAAEDKDRMEHYLRWLDRHEHEPGEDAPLGIMLCSGNSSEQIELLELGRGGVQMAEYLPGLPARHVLAQRLREATRRAQWHWAQCHLEVGQG